MSATAVRRALYGRLAGDTTLNNLLGTPAPGFAKAIYHAQAPAGAPFPYVILNRQSGVPTETFADPDALETDVWLIRATDKNTSADIAESVADRVKALLNDATLTISGATHLYLRRQSDVDFLETVAGVRYAHAGSLFRLVYE